VVICCLVISLVECLIILPAHLNHLPDPNVRKKHGNIFVRVAQAIHHTTNNGLEVFVDKYYQPFIDRTLRWRYTALAAALAVCFLTVGMMRGGIIKTIFFPKVDSDIITATIEFPDGTPLSVTTEAVRRLEHAFDRVAERTGLIKGYPLLQNMYSVTGTVIADNDIPRFGNNLGSVRVELLPTQVRNIPFEKLMVDWEEEVGVIPGVEALSFNGIEAGPPGAAIEIWVQGHDYSQILAAADALKEELGTFEGTYQIQHDFRPGKSELRLELKEEARTLGLTVADLARQVYAGYFGDEAVRLQRGRDDVRVRVRYPEDERQQISEFENIRIRTPQGMEVPLLSVANVSYGPGYATITRTDGMRRAAITAEVDSVRANTNEILADVETNFFPELRRQYPDVRVSLQGQKKESQDSMGSLMVTYPIAMLGIFIIIATIFRSYIQPIVIMLAIPFGVIGAILGHFLLGYEVSIMSIFGIVALSGVVVNDAIVLIECINENIASGMPVLKAIREGGKRRFRAIVLTTLSTVGGLTPLIMEKDMQAQFLIPMAVSIASGVAFATVLTLVLVPCFIAALNDLRRLAYWMRHGAWPTPEEVEPARLRRIDPDELETGPGGEIILEGN
jgi:multidrug efflux pump subunit AcrB